VKGKNPFESCRPPIGGSASHALSKKVTGDQFFSDPSDVNLHDEVLIPHVRDNMTFLFGLSLISFVL
jgi:hypothetical protein